MNTNDTEDFNKRMGITEDLKGPFNSYSLSLYTDEEIAELIDAFEKVAHPLAPEIRKLLIATEDFRIATTVDPFFKKARDQTLLMHEYLETLNLMAGALIDMDIKQQNEMDAEVAATLTKTIQYCIDSIHQRLKELKELNDKIYEIYCNEPNGLKPFFEKYYKKIDID